MRVRMLKPRKIMRKQHWNCTKREFGRDAMDTTAKAILVSNLLVLCVQLYRCCMFCLEDSRFKIHCFTAGFACYPSTAQVERWVKDHSPTTQAEPALVSSEAAHAAPTLVSSEAAQATLPTDGGETAQASLTLVSSEEAQADPNLVSSEEAQAALPTDGGETAHAAPTLVSSEEAQATLPTDGGETAQAAPTLVSS